MLLNNEDAKDILKVKPLPHENAHLIALYRTLHNMSPGAKLEIFDSVSEPHDAVLHAALST